MSGQSFLFTRPLSFTKKFWNSGGPGQIYLCWQACPSAAISPKKYGQKLAIERGRMRGERGEWAGKAAVEGRLWNCFYRSREFSVCTGRLGRMSHRKWRETKQQPSRARSGKNISCCLVSCHFLCDILLICQYRAEKNFLYVVARYFVLVLLSVSAWPCLDVA